jgi:MFS family permease
VNLTRSLHNRMFASLWFGQAISRLGDNLYRIALAWWVLEKTGSAAAMGAVLIFTTVPLLIFTLIGGVLVDRFPRPLVMLVSDVARGILVGAIAVLAMAGRLELWEVFLASLVFGFVDAFFLPAYTAIVPEVTAKEDLPSANSLTAISAEITGVAGPALGALIVGTGGTSLAFGLDAVSFGIAAMSLIPLIRIPARAVGKSKGLGAIWGDLREGVRTVAASPWLWVTICIAALGNMNSAGVMGTSLPLLVKGSWGMDVNSLGAIYSAISIGSVGVALILGSRSRIRRRGPLAYTFWAIAGLMILSFGLHRSLALALPAAAILGGGIACFGLIWTNSLQEMVPGELLGRVSSVDILGSYTLLPVGYALAGWASDRFGAPSVFLVAGAMTTLLAILGLMHPGIRKMD